tara:strand:+ start:36573 stop:36749 length:177 start_codon:yes stop_codon:yes gene_type:complete
MRFHNYTFPDQTCVGVFHYVNENPDVCYIGFTSRETVYAENGVDVCIGVWRIKKLKDE